MFTVTIDTDNAAFDPDPAEELIRILQIIAHRLEHGVGYGALYDINGNHVGEFRTKAAS